MKQKTISCLVLLLTSCSIFNNKQASTDLQSSASSSVQRQLLSQRAAQQFVQLQHNLEWDSLSYQVVVLAEGPYSFHPDSGIRGSNARILLQGQQQRWHSGSDSSGSMWLTRTDSLQENSQRQETIVQHTEKSSRTWGWSAWWLLLPVVVGAWVCWKWFNGTHYR